jgi:hypothetical protein
MGIFPDWAAISMERVWVLLLILEFIESWFSSTYCSRLLNELLSSIG